MPQVPISQRSESVSERDLLITHQKMCKDRATSHEIAEKLGMKYDSYKSRISQLRKRYGKTGRIVLYAADSGKGRAKKSDADRMNEFDALMESIGLAEDTIADDATNAPDASAENNASE